MLFTNTRILRQTFICALFSSTLKAALTDGLEDGLDVLLLLWSFCQLIKWY